MPVLQIGGTTCYYRLEGRDDAPVVVLSHSLGQDHTQWDPQAHDLLSHFRVLRYDLRGHGASGVTPGDYTVAQLGGDVLSLADALGIDRFAFCGLSLGGMIAQWLAIQAGERLTHLVLANTSPRPDAAGMEARRVQVLAEGMAAVADVVMGRFFSPATLASHSPIAAASRRVLLATDPVGYAGCCAAVRDMDETHAVSSIRMPVLIISGDHDPSLPWQGHGERLATAIPAATVVHLPTAHLSNLEAPRSFTAALFDALVPRPGDPYEAGMRIRRAVLGDAHVDRATATAASAEFQRFITRCAWGAIWTRPGLDVRARRLLVCATTAAMGRWEEFRLHVRTGFAHELEWCDLEEVLLQTAVYAGVPAANHGFHIAAEERAARQAPLKPTA
jgi:3-oxoadipate enol-lactonase/4-carboxymuconolactone decarboxylase